MEDLREVILPDYAIARNPVTFREYLAYIDELGAEDPEAGGEEGEHEPDHRRASGGVGVSGSSNATA